MVSFWYTEFVANATESDVVQYHLLHVIHVNRQVDKNVFVVQYHLLHWFEVIKAIQQFSRPTKNAYPSKFYLTPTYSRSACSKGY